MLFYFHNMLHYFNAYINFINTFQANTCIKNGRCYAKDRSNTEWCNHCNQPPTYSSVSNVLVKIEGEDVIFQLNVTDLDGSSPTFVSRYFNSSISIASNGTLHWPSGANTNDTLVVEMKDDCGNKSTVQITLVVRSCDCAKSEECKRTSASGIWSQNPQYDCVCKVFLSVCILI